MKKIILATVLFVALCTASFAGGKDKQLVKDLTTALMNAKQVSRSSNENHNKAFFDFNGKTVVAYYDREDNNLIGYSFLLTPADLPEASRAAIEKKYPGWEITETIMFIDSYGYSSHYVRVKNDKNDMALKVNNEKVSFFRHMLSK